MPHGNSKKSNAARYVRTKRSVIEDLKEVSATKKPKQAFQNVDVQKGGIVNAKSESDLLRNREQAQNQRRGISSKQVDSLILMLMNSKRQQLGSPENYNINNNNNNNNSNLFHNTLFMLS